MKIGMLALLPFILGQTAIVNSKVWTCEIKATRGYSVVTPTKMKLDFDKAPGSVIISDDVGPKIGKDSYEGKMTRRVGNVQLFTWELSPIPRHLKPQTQTNLYHDRALFSGRLDRSSGAITLVGNFVIVRSTVHVGLNMRAKGTCK